MSKEICQRCGENDYDRRTLWMACFYAMNELGLPFDEKRIIGRMEKKLAVNETVEGKPFEHHEVNADFFTLRVCKDCRADWMGAIKTWFNDKPVRESCGSGIFVRRNGATVEITREEWDELNPGREPVVAS